MDSTDQQLIALLRQDARLTVATLAQKLGVSRGTVTNRLRKLEDEGVITGYHARLNPAAVGQAMLVFVELKMAIKSDEVFNQVKAQIGHVPHVLECHLVTGDFDFLVKARIAEMSQYRRLLGEILLKLPGATESRSYIVMEEIKETLILPVEA